MGFFVYISVHRTSNIWFGNGRSILRRGGINCRRRPCNREDYGIWFTKILFKPSYKQQEVFMNIFKSVKNNKICKMNLFLRLFGFFSGLENTTLSTLKGRLLSRKWLLTVFFSLNKKGKSKSFQKKEHNQLFDNYFSE